MIICKTDRSGNKRWYKDGKLHRDDGPAFYYKGDGFWYQNGKMHRDDGPAVEKADGTLLWYCNDRQHRLDGPAVTYSNFSSVWYVNGKICKDWFVFQRHSGLTDEEITLLVLKYGEIG